MSDIGAPVGLATLIVVGGLGAVLLLLTLVLVVVHLAAEKPSPWLRRAASAFAGVLVALAMVVIADVASADIGRAMDESLFLPLGAVVGTTGGLWTLIGQRKPERRSRGARGEDSSGTPT